MFYLNCGQFTYRSYLWPFFSPQNRYILILVRWPIWTSAAVALGSPSKVYSNGHIFSKTVYFHFHFDFIVSEEGLHAHKSSYFNKI